MNFDPVSLSLLSEITVGDTLKFKSDKTGEIIKAEPKDTLLVSENLGQVDIYSKFKNTIKVTAFDPTNPRMVSPCPKCKRQVVSYQRLGESKKLIKVCVCGYKF
jgi:hypothetical protein